jgi:hypothetical protein
LRIADDTRRPESVGQSPLKVRDWGHMAVLSDDSLQTTYVGNTLLLKVCEERITVSKVNGQFLKVSDYGVQTTYLRYCVHGLQWRQGRVFEGM